MALNTCKKRQKAAYYGVKLRGEVLQNHITGKVTFMKKLSLTILATIVITSGNMFAAAAASDDATSIAARTADVINCFAGRNTNYTIEDFCGPIKLITIPDEKGLAYNFFGIEKDQQSAVNFATFKTMLARKLRISPAGTLEIVGDSAPFSDEGSDYVRTFLRNRFAGKHMIEYGFTGYLNKTDHRMFDTNALLNEYLDENPIEAHRVLGNVLGHTIIVLTSHGCQASRNVRNFVVVYNEAGTTVAPVYDETTGRQLSGSTTFGDDVTMSDYLLQADNGDYLVCIEGGAQSFRQVVNALMLDVPIEFVYNVRLPDPKDGGFNFSAARFLNQVKAAFADGTPSEEQVRTVLASYISTLRHITDTKTGESTPVIWAPNRADSRTKRALFEDAIKAFFDNRLYERVDALCTFYNATAK